MSQVPSEPDFALACLLALDRAAFLEEVERILHADAKTRENKLEKMLAQAAQEAAFRAVYLRWRTMLRQCGVRKAEQKATQKGNEAAQALRQALLRANKRKKG